MTTDVPHHRRVNVVLRDDERVSPLELFFDLVFVLAITQCTASMAADPTWRGIGRSLVVLGLLWWSWVGYAWLTSVVDPDEGGVRLVLFAAMAALLVASLAVPDAFGDLGVTFAIAYAAVRAAQIVLFVLASRGDDGLRHSVLGLATSTAIGIALLLGGSLVSEDVRLVVWVVALALDMGGPWFIDTSGWRLAPEHFAERHGLIIIVALGESIVAIGVGAGSGVDGGVIAAAVLGIAVAATFWWAYFDVTALASAHRLASIESVGERNELARDGFSYLHLPMVASIVLVAFGMKSTLAHVGDPLGWQAGAALLGGSALYLLSQVAFTVRSAGALSGHRVAAAAVLMAFLAAVRHVDALAAVAFVAAVLASLIAYETNHDGEARRGIRAADREHHAAS